MSAPSTASTTTRASTGWWYIDPDECIDCGACEPACPVTAIFAEDDLPEDMAAFAEINVLWFKDKDAARAKVPA